MSLNPLLLQQDYHDFWGEFDAAAIRNLEKLDLSRCCYQPRYYVVPDYSRQRLTDGQVLEYVLSIRPGGFIWSLLHQGGGPDFLLQITDLALNRKMFSQPMPDDFFAQGGGYLGARNTVMPWFLPEIYPVVDPGQFLIELWNTSGATSRISLILAVAEVVE